MYIDVGPHSNRHFKITATSQRSLSNFRFSKRTILLKSKKKGNFTQKRRKHRHTFCFIERLQVAHQKGNRNDISVIFLQQILSDRLLLVVIIGAKK